MKQSLLLALPICLMIACQSNVENEKLVPPADEKTEITWSKEREEVKQAAEELLFHVGNYNHPAMAAMSLPDANVGLAGSGKSMTLQQYFDLVSDRSKQIPYYEPPHEYHIEISDGKLAFVRAKCFLYRLGVKQTYEDDFFTFIKSDEDWKLLSASYTAEILPENEQKFDMEAFAKSYAQVWGSTRPEFVALFFAEDGSLQVNEGEAAIGREQIAAVARGFMTDLPDMRVYLDSLVSDQDKHTFHWTLKGTHLASGNKINISGYEIWSMSEENLILQSLGRFDGEQYNDQTLKGTAN